jgi:hypothetical protein
MAMLFRMLNSQTELQPIKTSSDFLWTDLDKPQITKNVKGDHKFAILRHNIQSLLNKQMELPVLKY